MNDNMKKLVILDNYQNPCNRGLIEDNEYNLISTKSKSCIDQVDLQINMENNVIKDIRFDGEACAICTSTTSIMIKNLIGKTINEALNIINNYENMIEEKEYDDKIIGDAIVYCDIAKQPNRKNCALLTWQGIKDYLEKRN